MDFGPLMEKLGQRQAGPPEQTANQSRKTYSPEMERAARAAGFPNAETWVLWNQQRENRTGGVIVERGKGDKEGQRQQTQRTTQPAKPKTAAPANIFEYISSVLRNATGG